MSDSESFKCVLFKTPFCISDLGGDRLHDFSLCPRIFSRAEAGYRCQPHWVGARPIFDANCACVQRAKLRSVRCGLRMERLSRSTSEFRHPEVAPSSNQSGESQVREAIIEADLVEASADRTVALNPV